MTDYIVPDGYGTIQAAITQVETDGLGDIRRIRAKTGTYSENPVLGAVAWTDAAYIIIESFGGTRDVVIDGSGGNFAFDVNAQAYFRMNNIEVSGGIQHQILYINSFNRFENVKADGVGYCFFMHIYDSALFINCEATGGTWGFYVGWGTTLIGCYAHGNTTGVHCYALAGPVTLQGCYIVGNTTGLLATTTRAIINLYDSIFSGNTDGVYLQTAGIFYRAVRCIFATNSNYGIRLTGAYDWACMQSDWNCYYDNTNGHIYDGAAAKTTLAQVQTWTSQQTGRTEDANSIDSDPLEAADGTVASGSPTVNAGASVAIKADADYATYPPEPSIGADGQWDVIHEDPSPPAGQPSLDTVTVDQDTGVVTIEWTANTPGNTGKAYRSRAGTTLRTLVDSGAGDLADDLSALPHGDYDYIVEEFSGIYSGIASNEIRRTWAGEAVPAYHLERALGKRILDSEAVTDIIGAGKSCRLYPEMAEKSAALPYVLYRRVSSSSEQVMVSASSWAQARIQFDCYALTELGALNLAETLRRLFDGWRGTVDDTLDIDGLFCEEISTDLVPPTDGAEEGKYVASVDILAVYQAVVPT